MELRMCGSYIGHAATGVQRRNNNNGETEMPTVTWDHVHLRSPDPEGTAAWLQDILGGEIVRGPGRIDVKLGGANVFIAPVTAGDGVNTRMNGNDGNGVYPNGYANSLVPGTYPPDSNIRTNITYQQYKDGTAVTTPNPNGPGKGDRRSAQRSAGG